MTPKGGFDNDNLRTYLGRVAPTGSRTATRNTSTATSTPTGANHHPRSSVGKIAGGVLGGLAAVIVLLVIVLFCLRGRKRALASSSSNNDKPQPTTNMPLDNQRAAFTPKQPSLQDSPPPSWQPTAVNYIPQYQQRFVEDLPQQHYPMPPLPYYPPPAPPQQYEQFSPTYEMPNVRSPPNAGEGSFSNSRAFGGKRTPGAHERINEE